MKRVLLSLLAIAVLGLGGCLMQTPKMGAPEGAKPEAETPAGVEPEVISVAGAGAELVAEWTGIGTETTEPFTIESESWVIDWAHVPSEVKGQSIGTFQIMVYNVEEPDIPVVIAVNSQEREADVFTIEGKGTFYLMINAANTRWAVRVLVTPEDSAD